MPVLTVLRNPPTQNDEKDDKNCDDPPNKIDLDAAIKNLQNQDEEEFATWMEGLGQWPRKPKKVEANTKSSGDSNEKDANRISSKDEAQQPEPKDKDIFDTISETFKVIESTELRKQKQKDAQPTDPFLSLPPLP